MANLQNLADLAALQTLGNAAKAEAAKVAAKIPTKVSALTNDSGFQTESEVQTAIAAKIGSAYRPGGSKAFAELPEANAETVGVVYNITDDFVTTDAFVEGAGKSFSAGTDVGVVQAGEEYKYNVFANFVNLSGYVEKDGTKGLSTNDYTDSDVAKLNGIAEGATKVEQSENEGKIKVNGVDTTVVNIASAEDVAEVINGIFGTAEQGG